MSTALAHLELPISGMTCASCANRIERKLNKLDGVTATVNYATEKASVDYDPVAVDSERTTAWLHHQIAFDHESLERVAAEFNRYAAKPIEITTPALRRLEVSGVFATDDPEEILAFLRSLKGVHVEVTATAIRVSQK